jgi:predicted dehydrogenase
MRVLIVGAGSIGSRRARILAEMGHKVWTCDNRSEPTGREAPGEIHEVRDHFYDVETALAVLDHVDAAFICTPAGSHLKPMDDVLRAGIRGLFVEKPLGLSIEALDVAAYFAERPGIVTMGACNMRFAYDQDGNVAWALSPLLRHADPVWFVSSQPLPSWRPGAEAAYRRNGIVLEMAIHELDLVASAFGPILDVKVIALDDDLAVFHCETYGPDTYVLVNWSDRAAPARHIRTAGNDNVLVPDTSDAMYAREMKHFLSCVESGEETCNPIAQAAETLRWALEVNDARQAQGGPTQGAGGVEAAADDRHEDSRAGVQGTAALGAET